MALTLFPRTPIAGFSAPSSRQWSPYTFPASIILATILLIVGIGIILLGRRIKTGIRLPHPGKSVRVVILVVWALSLIILLPIYIMRAQIFPGAIQTGPVFPITIASAAGTFVYLAYIYRREKIRTIMGNALLGAAAGPMVFEFLFDCIVLPQIKAPISSILIFFVPLFIAVLLTLTLLLLSTRTSITRYSAYSLGAMFIAFAAWAFVGFSYPSSLLPFLFNAISKVLSFVTVAALFSKKPVQTT